MRTLSETEARRLAVLGQGLAGARPGDPVAVATHLGRVQMDPTLIVDRAERLTMFSRLGAFERAELRRLVEEPPRRLFEYDAHLIPVDDLALHRPRMGRFSRLDTARGRYTRDWLEANEAFRRYVLNELGERGPLRSVDLEDRAVVPWQTHGWNDGKNLGRMLELLHWGGEIAVARREGATRWWDRFDRVVPTADVLDLTDFEVARALVERQLRARGLVRPRKPGPLDYGLPERSEGEASLVADGIAVPVDVEGIAGSWLAHAAGLAELDGGAWTPRTTILGPFDPLISDRARTLELFGFQYAFELYVPAVKRTFGPYALVVLDGDRLIGRLDAALDRVARVFRVRRIWPEPDAPPAAPGVIRNAIDDLAAWLGAPVEMGD